MFDKPVNSNGGGSSDNVPEEDLLAIYGPPEEAESALELSAEKRTDFRPWHHPVKQIVRDHQWAALTRRLVQERSPGSSQVLKYFTLPGADLLDVRVLAEACEPLGVKIEYFGFDSGTSSDQAGNNTGVDGARAQTTIESALLQAGRTVPTAVILPDRLEDIALATSQAAIQLGQRLPFDVINIDACDHLAYCPAGRTSNTFDALQALLKHQMGARSPWLLFITTRAEPALLGQPGVAFQHAITENLSKTGSDFGTSLANCLQADVGKLGTELAMAWGTHDAKFLRLYTVGLGKFLLQFFHGQPNLPANVELASCYAYRVYGQQPDMLALAFRIIPDGPKVYGPSVGGATTIPDLEPARAAHVAKQASKLQDLDEALVNEAEVREGAVKGTKALLESANYDIGKWCEWLAGHERRPMAV